MIEDAELLRRYAEHRSEEAFTELVQRHLALVYGAALRQVGGGTHRAEDVTQAVFTDLARKAGSLCRRSEIAGWLYTSTHFAAAKLKRAEQRRQLREQEAHLMRELASESLEEQWAQLRPVLDDALQSLERRERDLILMRFFQDFRLAEVAQKLGISEDAARMRVERALGKLHASLTRRRITSTAAALGLILANQPALAMPAGLAASVSTAALHHAAIATTSLSAGVLSFMSTSKIIWSGTALVLVLTMGTLVHELMTQRQARTTLAAARQELAALETQLGSLEQRVASVEQSNARKRAELRVQTAALRTAELARSEEFFARHPEVLRAGLEKLRAETRGEYAPLFKLLRLSPAEIERFTDLILQGQTKAFSGRNSQRLTYQIPGNRAQAEQKLRTLLGEDGFRQYQNSGPLSSAWRTALELAGILYYTPTPLSAEQGEQLMRIVMDGLLPEGATKRRMFDWDAIMPRARTVLSSPQLAALAELQSRDLVEGASSQIRQQIWASLNSRDQSTTPPK